MKCALIVQLQIKKNVLRRITNWFDFIKGIV